MRPEDVPGELESVLFSEAQVLERVQQLADEIAHDFSAEPPLFIGVLTGSVMLVADLVRGLPFHSEIDWIGLSSYGSGTESSGEIRIAQPLHREVTGRDVIVVEDIVDTGLTLSWLIQHLLDLGARSVRVCALLRKPDAAQVVVSVDYLGFDIPNAFVVGYGLDFNQRYRNLRDIAVLDPKMYT